MRVLFASVPNAGHLLPMMPLARVLLARGDSVAVLTEGSMAGLVEPEGITFLAAGPPTGEIVAHAQQTVAAWSPPDEAPTWDQYFFGGSRIDLAGDESLALARGWQPDLVIGDIADYIAQLVAADLGIPWAMLAYGVARPAEISAAVQQIADQKLAARGLRPTPALCYLDTCPPSFNTPDFEPIADRVLLRTEAYRRPWAQPAQIPAKGSRPRVLVTFGTFFGSPELLSPLLRELSTLDVDIMATLASADAAQFDVDPARVTLAPFAPLDELLKDVDVVVTHGGAGSTLGTLTHGVPLVVLPQGADHPRQAVAVLRTGAGITLTDDEATPAAVAAAVTKCLGDSTIRANAARLAQEIADMPSPDEVAKLLAESVSQSRS